MQAYMSPPHRDQTSSELWVHIPAVFLKNGCSPGEGKEALSESRSLVGDPQATTEDSPGSPTLAVSHESVSGVHFSPTLQTCAPRAATRSAETASLHVPNPVRVLATAT